MNRARPARRHHYVPQFYLRAFTDADGRVNAFNLVDRRRFRSSTQNLAVQSDFNRVELEGLPIDVIEQAYGNVESQIAGAHAEMCSNRQVPEDPADFHLVLYLLALTYARHPTTRASIEESVAQLTRVVLQFVTSSEEIYLGHVARAHAAGYRIDDDYETARDLAHSDAFDVAFPHGFHVNHEIGLIDEVARMLSQREWRLFDASGADERFITADRPIAVNPLSFQRGHPYGLGLMSDETMVTFPISPELALLGTFAGTTGVDEVTDEIVRVLNFTTLRGATRMVYSSRQVFRFEGIEGTQTSETLVD